MDVLNLDPRVVILQALGVLLLLAVFKKFLFAPIQGALQSRQDEIRATYDAAESEKAQMEQLRADYERRLADIEAEARQRIQAAIKEAQVSREQILNEARERAERALSRGQEEIIREKEKAIVELRREVVDLTINAAGKLIGQSLDEASHKRLVEEFIESVEAKG